MDNQLCLVWFHVESKFVAREYSYDYAELSITRDNILKAGNIVLYDPTAGFGKTYAIPSQYER